LLVPIRGQLSPPHALPRPSTPLVYDHSS
jgi:hypothetical protein